MTLTDQQVATTVADERASGAITASDPTDGRRLRRTRNRTAVISALLELMREGNLTPSATEIADRAGVSHRSIFRYFDDLDDLVRTTIDQAVAEAGPAGRISGFGKGTLDERIATFVESRLHFYTRLDGPMRVARMRSYSIPALDVEFTRIFDRSREQISTHFAEELARFDAPEDGYVVDAVLALASHDSYSVHIRLLGSDIARIRQSWTFSLRTLLASRGAD